MKQIVGQLEQVYLSKEAHKRGFRIEKGFVVKYVLDDAGNPLRKRKNWANSIRAKSRQYIQDNCEMCPSSDGLQIHHIQHISMGGGAERENCVTLCNDCHDIAHDRVRNVFKVKRVIKVKKVKEIVELPIFKKGLWGEYRFVD